MNVWESELHDLHFRLIQAEWPEDRPFNKDQMLAYIAERDEDREAKSKEAQSGK